MKIMKKCIMLALMVVIAAGCEKWMMRNANPEELDFAAAEFNVELNEKRCYAHFNYVIPEDQAPVVTAWNAVTISAVSDDSAFNGVNVSSSDPSVVSVSRTDDPSVYTLEYHSDGSAQIRVWNSLEEKTFRIETQHTIDVEGLLMRVHGEEFVVKADTSLPGPYDKDYPADWVTNEKITDDLVYFDTIDWGDSYEVEIVDLVPSNASFRIVARLWAYNTSFGEMQDWFDPEYKEGCEYQRYNIKDVSSVLGKRAVFYQPMDVTKTSKTKRLILTLKTNCTDYSTPAEQIGYTTMYCGCKVRVK